MPYLAIKTLPKEEHVKREAVDALLELLPKVWGCPKEAVTISIEEYSPEEYRRDVQPEVDAKKNALYAVSGKQTF